LQKPKGFFDPYALPTVFHLGNLSPVSAMTLTD
jgi:hypothetical protein